MKPNLRCLFGTLAAAVAMSPALADTPQVLWTWSFPPFSINDNVECVLGGPDFDGDGYPDALVAAEDYKVRALSGHSTNPPAVIWTFGGADEKPISDRALSLYWPDRDGDGKPEILYNTGTNDRSVHFLRSSNGTEIWGFDLRSTGCTDLAWLYGAVPIGDVTGDGVPDVASVSGGPCNKVFVVDAATGALAWQYTAVDGCRSVAAAGDMTGDGIPDVLAGCGTNNSDNRVMLLSGALSPQNRVIWQHYAAKMVAAVGKVQDFTGDFVEEAIAGSWDGTAFMVSGGSAGTVPSPLWETAVGGSSAWVSHTLVIPDLDGDCVDDIAVASWTPQARILSGRTGSPLWTSQPIGTANYAYTGAIIPDVTGDAQWDLVVGAGTTGGGGGFVALFSGLGGEKIWEWSVSRNVKSVAWIGDISGDGLPDVLAGAQDLASAYALSGRALGACIRPTGEVAGLRASRLDSVRVQLTWDASTDVCHDRYRVYGVPAEVRGLDGCYAHLMDITDQDEDGDATNGALSGPGEFFGYLVIDQGAAGGKGPLGHFRR